MTTPIVRKPLVDRWLTLSDLDPEGDAVTLLNAMVDTARTYAKATGGTLSIYQDLGALFASACYGITLNHSSDGGPDGWLDQVPVYIRVIAPEARNAAAMVEAKAPQGHLFVVRVSEKLELMGKLFPCAFSRQDRVMQTSALPPLKLAANT